jgi:hypothetical protein
MPVLLPRFEDAIEWRFGGAAKLSKAASQHNIPNRKTQGSAKISYYLAQKRVHLVFIDWCGLGDSRHKTLLRLSEVILDLGVIADLLRQAELQVNYCEVGVNLG